MLEKTVTYQEARKEFFSLEPDQSIVITLPRRQAIKFRDSIYKLSKRYKAYDKLFRTKFINPKKLQIWRIK